MRLRTAVTAATASLAVAASVTVTDATAAERAPASAPHACSSSTAVDGFYDGLDKTLFQGTAVGNLSGLAVDTDGTVAALSDRSQLFNLKVGTGPVAAPVRVVPLADEQGRQLDSEAVVVERDGTRLITSEIEPSIRRYDRDGKLLGRLPVPDALRVAPAGRAVSNATFEGLALQPGGHTLIASMEAPCQVTARTRPVIRSYGSRPGTGAARRASSRSPGSTPTPSIRTRACPRSPRRATADCSSWSAASPRASAIRYASSSPTRGARAM